MNNHIFKKPDFLFGCEGLHCCMQALSNWGKRGVPSSGGEQFSPWRLLLPQSTGSGERGLSSCSPRLWGTGSADPQHVNLSGSGIEPMAPALAGRFFATEPPGKSSKITWSVKGLSALVKRHSLPDPKPQPNYMLSVRKPL